VRVRFAPSPTGSLHLGNALTAVANRRFADEHGGVLVLRIDDTDSAHGIEGGEEGILRDLAWLGVGVDEGPVRQSARGEIYRAAAARLVAAGAAVPEADGSVRVSGAAARAAGASAAHRPTLVRPDGSATYHLASVADDVDLRITHVIRGADHRSNAELHLALFAALGAPAPEILHHGLILGDDGSKLSKRDAVGEGAAAAGAAAPAVVPGAAPGVAPGADLVSIADFRAAGIPAEAVRAYLEELGLPRHDVRLDLPRVRRLAVEALAALSDEELAARAEAPLRLVAALRGARDLVEARDYAESILRPDFGAVPASAPGAAPASPPSEALPTLLRFAELRAGAADELDDEAARSIVRELKAVHADLKALRRALTGRERGPELWAVVRALVREEALARAGAAPGGLSG
jgi:glutamyl-tRNA synthetase